MKQVISLGSGLGGDKFMEVSDARSEFLVQSTAVDRHNFKGSLGITLECLQALWSNCSDYKWGFVVVLLLRPLVTLHM